MAANLEVVFAGDTKSLDAAFKRTRSQADSFGRAVDDNTKRAGGALGRLGSTLKGFGAGLVAGLSVDAVVGFGAEMLSTFEDVEANAKRLNVTFGDQAGAIRTLADNLNEFAGVGQLAMEGFATQVGSVLVPLGFSREQVAGLTTDAVELANGLALASNVPFEQAITAVTSALVGERESLKSLGVVIDESMIQEELARQGKENLTGAALRQAEAEAALSLITQQSSDDQQIANGIMAEGGTASNNLKAALDDLKTMLATQLGPKLQDAARFLGDVARGLVEGDGALEEINPDAENFADNLRSIADAASDAYDMLSKVKGIGDEGLGGINGLLNRFNGLFPEKGLLGRANGGLVTRPTVVGERGPELLFPSRNGGTVIPHGKAGYGMGGPTKVEVNVAGSVVAERDLAYTIEGIINGRSRYRG